MSYRLIPSPRPENEKDFSFQDPDHKLDFMECDTRP